ncbi:unnamed protein product [Meloidogyne enterolobii]|uniref:Uncharacterized protein n=1 Tax=Meloidogyne enterolobii TaxID=390850 RepID=A0ACB0YJH7_MELEN
MYTGTFSTSCREISLYLPFKLSISPRHYKTTNLLLYLSKIVVLHSTKIIPKTLSVNRQSSFL